MRNKLIIVSITLIILIVVGIAVLQSTKENENTIITENEIIDNNSAQEEIPFDANKDDSGENELPEIKITNSSDIADENVQHKQEVSRDSNETNKEAYDLPEILVER